MRRDDSYASWGILEWVKKALNWPSFSMWRGRMDLQVGAVGGVALDLLNRPTFLGGVEVVEVEGVLDGGFRVELRGHADDGLKVFEPVGLVLLVSPVKPDVVTIGIFDILGVLEVEVSRDGSGGCGVGGGGVATLALLLLLGDAPSWSCLHLGLAGWGRCWWGGQIHCHPLGGRPLAVASCRNRGEVGVDTVHQVLVIDGNCNNIRITALFPGLSRTHDNEVTHATRDRPEPRPSVRSSNYLSEATVAWS